MADALTTTASLLVDQTAYDKYLYFALRRQMHFDQVADVKPTNLSMQGAAVKFTIVDDIAVASTALSESVDVDAVPMSDSQVTLTLAEYGNAIKTTRKVRGTSFVPLDPAVASVIAYNAAISLDTIARDVLKAGTNVRYAAGGVTVPAARNQVESVDTLTSKDVRRARVDLATNNVMSFNDHYVAFIHPDVSYDLRSEAGNNASWREPHVYSQPDEIWNGTIGRYEGCEFIETTGAPIFADAGSSTTLTDVYATIFVGRQALAKTFSTVDGNGGYPTVVATPITDNLRRFVGFGWYFLGNYGRFREAAIRRVETASSIGAN